MAMVDMQMTAEQAKEFASPSPVADVEVPRYAYGLCIRLCEEDLQKLRMEPPAVGTIMMLSARVKVTSTSVEELRDGSADSHVSLQITDMELSPAQRSREDLAAAIYRKE